MNRFLPVFIFYILVVTDCNSNSTSANTETDTTSTSANSASTDSVTQIIAKTHALADAMNRMVADMEKMQMTGDSDNDFAKMMKRHHIGAIEMANVELNSGKDRELKSIAQRMINDQQKQMTKFDSFLSTHSPHTRSDFGQKAMQMMQKSGDSSLNMHGADMDLDFASMMIQHHSDAVNMIKEYMKAGTEPDIKKIAQELLISQPQEIKKLKNWKNNHRPGIE